MHPATAQVLEHLTEIEHWPDAAIGEIGDPFRRLALYLVGDPDKVKPGEYMPSLSPLEDTGALGLDGPEVTVMLRKLLEARDCAMRASGRSL